MITVMFRSTTFSVALTMSMMSFSGCAARAAVAGATPALGGPAARVVELPAAPGLGNPREVQVLVDEPALKLVAITLRDGTVLPEHEAPVPVTILALSGGGHVTAGAERFRLDPEHAVVLAPSVPHAVEPDAGTDLVLLVHHLGRRDP
jgi:quercetin dioxygenase-like cupin family protein